MSEWTLIEQVTLGVFAVMWLYQLYFWMRYILAAVRRTKTRAESQKSKVESLQPGVSVIVCAKNELANLRDYMQALLTQDYPEYEVIIVNDGSVDDTRTYLEYWQKRYKNLKLTFVPVGAKVTSTKKLAITLGAKAAQYDYLLLTDADCRPESKHWISEMMAGFGSQESSAEQRREPNSRETKDIVLGFGAYFVKPTLLNRMIQFDTLFNGLQYLGLAVCGHPYMGVGRNLAYSKRLFFEHGGFVGLLDNKAGDDDLFVNREATKDNTAVVCTRESLTWSVPKTSLGDWLHQKRRHLSVAPKYKTSTKFRLALEPVTRGLLYAAAIVLVVIGCQQAVISVQWSVISLLPMLIALGAMLVRWIWQCVLLNIAASRWGTTKTILLIPVWEIWLPVLSLVMMLIEPLRPKQKKMVKHIKKDTIMEEKKMNISISPDKAAGTYSNLAIIAHSQNEFIMDFASVMPGIQQANVQSRIIMTPENAKRLLLALQDNVAKYEKQYGQINLSNRQQPIPGSTFPLSFGSGEA